MTTTDGLEHLEGLRPVLREALRPLAEALTFTWHSTELDEQAQMMQVLFDCPATGHTLCCTVPLDGSPATLCRVD